MTRKVKALSLALFAMFALGAMATAAQAEETPEYFHSNFEKTVLTGHSLEGEAGDSVFTAKVGGTPIVCHTAEFEGLVEGSFHAPSGTYTTANHATVHPEYSDCDDFATQKVTVDTNNCHYALSPTTENGHGTVDIVECPSSAPIKITIGTLATISIGNQSLPAAVAYENVGGHIRVNATTGNQIAFTCAPALACALGGVPTSGTTASYTGDVTVSGFQYLDGTTGHYEEGPEATISKGPTTS